MAIITKALEAYARHRQYRNTLGELSALTDRDLRDLGISRFDIARIAHEAVYV